MTKKKFRDLINKMLCLEPYLFPLLLSNPTLITGWKSQRAYLRNIHLESEFPSYLLPLYLQQEKNEKNQKKWVKFQDHSKIQFFCEKLNTSICDWFRGTLCFEKKFEDLTFSEELEFPPLVIHHPMSVFLISVLHCTGKPCLFDEKVDVTTKVPDQCFYDYISIPQKKRGQLSQEFRQKFRYIPIK
jgi:hypothetical protein